MDMEEIQYLLGSAIFARAKKYVKRIESYECKTEENGVRHLSAEVEGSGDSLYETEAWLRQNGSFVSASCTCPYNDNGNGLFCKHIGRRAGHGQPARRPGTGPEGQLCLRVANAVWAEMAGR